MIENIKIMLGDAANNYTDAQISLLFNHSIAEIETYCNRSIDKQLEVIAERITVIKLNRMNSEGLTSQAYSGVSESYMDGYPQDIINALNRKRKLKVI